MGGKWSKCSVVG
nr:Nef [Human immunodeficiency virus 1]